MQENDADRAILRADGTSDQGDGRLTDEESRHHELACSQLPGQCPYL